MSKRIEIKLPQKLNKELEILIADEGESKNEVIIKALEDYLYIRKFRLLRKRLSTKAKKQSVESDEDIFKAVS